MDLNVIEQTKLASEIAACATNLSIPAGSLGPTIDSIRSKRELSEARQSVMASLAGDTEADPTFNTSESERIARYAKQWVSTVSQIHNEVAYVKGSVITTDNSRKETFAHYMSKEQPNRYVYRLASSLFRKPIETDPRIRKRMQMAVTVARLRTIRHNHGPSVSSPLSIASSEAAAWFWTVSSQLERCYKLAMGLKSALDRAAKAKMSHAPREVSSVKRAIARLLTESFDGFTLFPLGDMIVVQRCGERFLLTYMHYSRLLHMFRAFSHTSMYWRDLSPNASPREALGCLLSVAASLKGDYVDYFPAGMRGLKQATVAGMDTSDLMGGNARKMLIETFDEGKRVVFESCSGALSGIFTTKESLANFCNLYKAMPHPDYSPAALFDSIDGLDNPNPVEMSRLSSFEGRVRRTLYIASLKRSLAVVVTPTHEDDTSEVDAAAKLNSGMGSIRVAHSVSDKTWSGLKLSACQTSPEAYALEAENKASARDISFHDFPKAGRPGKVTQNDMTKRAEIGQSYINVERAYRNFRELHRTRDAALMYGHPYEPSRYPHTNTSPKFGEYHKRHTRLFYLATRDMKSVLQTIERTVKQIIAKQKGVSITKGAKDRRRSMELMARAHGSVDGKTTVYVSFDMSEFSKRFPPELTRSYLKVVGELTGVDDLSDVADIFNMTYVGFASETFNGQRWNVTGGFEGFLNFTWTSIHEVIMQIALDSAGVKGHLETFSDDGILMLYVPDGELGAFKDKAEEIQRVYSEHGLIFHFTKTLASTNVWEFLGDISNNGRIIPQFIKEAAKVGSTEYTAAFRTTVSKLVGFQAQVTAALLHGGSVDLVMVTLHWRTLELIEGFRDGIKESLAYYLLVMPPSMGGFRVPSIVEVATRGTKIPASELQCDINIGLEVYGTNFSRLLNFAQMMMKDSEVDVSVLTSNIPISSPNLSIVNRGIINGLIDRVSGRFPGLGLITDPLQGRLGRELSDLIRKGTNILPGSMTDLIMSSPIMTRYHSSSALVESPALLRLLEKRYIMRAQASDTRKVMSSLEALHISTTVRVSAQFPSEEIFVDYSLKKCHPLIKFVKIPMSHRESFAIVSAPQSDDRRSMPTFVEFSFLCKSHMDDIPVDECVEDFTTGTSTAIWATEGAVNDPQRRARSFKEKVAEYLAHNAGLEGIINTLAAASGIPPVIDESVRRAIASRDKQGSSVGYLTYSPLKACTFLTQGSVLGFYRSTTGTADRSTHVPTLKLIATSVYLSLKCFEGFHQGSTRIYFSANESKLIYRSWLPKVSFPESKYSLDGVDEELEEYFREAVDDIIQQESIARTIYTTGASPTPDMVGQLAVELSTLFTSIYLGGDVAARAPYIPPSFHNAVPQAIAIASANILDPRLRAALSYTYAAISKDIGEGYLPSEAIAERCVNSYSIDDHARHLEQYCDRFRDTLEASRRAARLICPSPVGSDDSEGEMVEGVDPADSSSGCTSPSSSSSERGLSERSGSMISHSDRSLTISETDPRADESKLEVIERISEADLDLVLEAVREVRSIAKVSYTELDVEGGVFEEGYLLYELVNHCVAQSLFRPGVTKILGTSSSSKPTHTSGLLGAYKRALTATLADVKMYEKTQMVGKKGVYADVLVCMRGALYNSSHRSTPWNNRVLWCLLDVMQTVRQRSNNVAPRCMDDVIPYADGALSDTLVELGSWTEGRTKLDRSTWERLRRSTISTGGFVAHMSKVARAVVKVNFIRRYKLRVPYRSEYEEAVRAVTTAASQKVTVIRPSVFNFIDKTIPWDVNLDSIRSGIKMWKKPLRVPLYAGFEEVSEFPPGVMTSQLAPKAGGRMMLGRVQTLDEAIQIVASAVSTYGIGVFCWQGVDSMGPHYEIALSEVKGSIIVSESLGDVVSKVAPVAGMVSSLIRSSGRGLLSVNNVSISRFTLGRFSGVSVSSVWIDHNTYPEIASIAALAASNKELDDRLKIANCIRFRSLVRDGIDTPLSTISAVLKRLALRGEYTSNNMRVRLNEVLTDALSLHQYLSTSHVDSSVVPSRYPGYSDWALPQAGVLSVTSGFTGREIEDIHIGHWGTLPGSIWYKRDLAIRDDNDNDDLSDIDGAY